MSVSRTLYPLLSTGSNQEDSKFYRNDRKSVELDVKHKNEQKCACRLRDLDSAARHYLYISTSFMKRPDIYLRNFRISSLNIHTFIYTLKTI